MNFDMRNGDGTVDDDPFSHGGYTSEHATHAILKHHPRAQRLDQPIPSHIPPPSSAPTHSSSRYPPTLQLPLSRHSSPRSSPSPRPEASPVSPHPGVPKHPSRARWLIFTRGTLCLSGATYR